MTPSSSSDDRHVAVPADAPVRVVAALLFCSGLSALVYQVLWLRLLGLVFGVTTHAATTVLASFMAGLALGSVTGGRLADRVRRLMARPSPCVAGGCEQHLNGIFRQGTNTLGAC